MTDEILSLQDKMKCLEKENQYLKSLLDRAGISYYASDEMKNRDLFDPDQGKRIIPREITDHDANLFFGKFWGRTDVYAKRTLKKSTGEINYYTQCYNFYKAGCPRMSGSKIRCQDIAMAGSVCKKGEFHRRLKEYGMVIVDECHHAASDTFVEILQEVRAKYVYGVTATPLRSDGLEKINYMLLGPVRYQFTAKDRAKEQGIAHLVYPRFTRAVAPRFHQDNMHPNEAYAILRENEDRDALIVNDVIKCIAKGRTPVILSRYVDHSRKLYDRLKSCADEVFLLSGENTKKQHHAVLEQMKQVEADKSMILVATGKLIGEGFDYPRLDTLIMAMPVSWKSVVEQYAGRLNRDYEGKESVIIYDYVDSHISMFEKMHHKRLKAYKQIGYDICAGYTIEKQKVGAIFDTDTYAEVYRKDLLEANKEIIIASPVISGPKIEVLIQLLKDQQEKGIRIRIVTWEADRYGFGDSAYWMELQERMRANGFEINLVEDYCQHYCIVDREVVWYGSMNFLGKEDSEDNLMRVCSKEIAAELLELTFGKQELIIQTT